MGGEDGYTIGNLWETGDSDKTRQQDADLCGHSGILFSKIVAESVIFSRPRKKASILNGRRCMNTPLWHLSWQRGDLVCTGKKDAP